MAASSLERIYPGSDNKNETIAGFDTVKLHLERYHYAGKHLSPGNIADIACGAGYGSYLLVTEYAGSVKKIVAVDNNADAISYANNHYLHKNICFIRADALDFVSTEMLDSIISLETIEHLEHPEKFILHCSAQLKKGGHFIASAPIVPTKDANPYHLHDFTKSSFKKLFTEAGFTEKFSMIQVQHYKRKELRGKKEGRSKEIRTGLTGYYLKNPGKFFLRLFSLIKDGFTIKYMVAVFEKK